MNGREHIFLRQAITAAGGRDGNFDFDCPICGGYAIGNLKLQPCERIQASCNSCGIYVRSQISEKSA